MIIVNSVSKSRIEFNDFTKILLRDINLGVDKYIPVVLQNNTIEYVTYDSILRVFVNYDKTLWWDKNGEYIDESQPSKNLHIYNYQ